MPGIQEQAKTAIRSFLKKDIDIRIFQIPTGRFNTTYIADTGQDKFIIRIAPADDAGFVFYEKNMMAQEPRIHQLVRDKTSVPVPEILLYDDSRKIMARNYLIMEYMDGKPLSEAYVGRKDIDRIYKKVGEWLGEVHTKITADQYGYLGEHRPMVPQKDWRRAFRIMWDKMADNIFDIGEYSQEERDGIKDLLTKHKDRFTRNVKSSLLHMDVWSQNIMVSDRGEAAGLLDWDRALWGDPEIEFAVLDYCGVSEPPFWQGYGQSRDTSGAGRIRNVFYLLYEIQKYIIIHKLRRKNIASARGYKAQVFDILRRF